MSLTLKTWKKNGIEGFTGHFEGVINGTV